MARRKRRPKEESPAIPNFRWVIPGELAGSAMPLSIENVKKAGIGVVSSFVPEDDLLYKSQGWRAKAEKAGVDFHTIDIENLSVPTRKQFKYFLRLMDEAMQRPEKPKVLVHCLMGVGRTGTMAAAYLIGRRGVYLEEAYRIIIKGLRMVYYDTFATRPGFLAKLRGEGKTLKDFLREMPLHFPESPAQENFLKMVERDFRQRTRRSFPGKKNAKRNRRRR